jgi:glucosamine--fructose-6-phosphate aminotransferase (isomerizing)
MLSSLANLQQSLQAELVLVSNLPNARELAHVHLAFPEDVPEWLSPIVGIIPAQLFTYHLALAKGMDPERPRTIQKVIHTL